MRRQYVMCMAILVVLLSPIAVAAQSTSSASVPRLITITGVYRPADGQPPNAVETVTLSIYADQEGGTPLWQETQSVTLDNSGRYTLQLGATHADGIPAAVSASGAQCSRQRRPVAARSSAISRTLGGCLHADFYACGGQGAASARSSSLVRAPADMSGKKIAPLDRFGSK